MDFCNPFGELAASKKYYRKHYTNLERGKRGGNQEPEPLLQQVIHILLK
jgi:hypothetical protein